MVGVECFRSRQSIVGGIQMSASNMHSFKEQILRSANFEALANELNRLTSNNPLLVQGVAGSMLAFVASYIFERTGKQVFITAADEDRAEKLRDDCALLIGEGYVRFF